MVRYLLDVIAMNSEVQFNMSPIQFLRFKTVLLRHPVLKSRLILTQLVGCYCDAAKAMNMTPGAVGLYVLINCTFVACFKPLVLTVSTLSLSSIKQIKVLNCSYRQ